MNIFLIITLKCTLITDSRKPYYRVIKIKIYYHYYTILLLSIVTSYYHYPLFLFIIIIIITPDRLAV